MNDTDAAIHELYPQHPGDWRGIGRSHREARERVLERASQPCNLHEPSFLTPDQAKQLGAAIDRMLAEFTARTTRLMQAFARMQQGRR